LIVTLAISLPIEASGQGAYVARAELSGPEVVPPTESDGSAVVDLWTFRECPHEGWTPLNVTVVYENLSGEPAGLHIHVGEPEQNRERRYTVFETAFDSGATTELEVDPQDCEFFDHLFSNGTYCVITTESFPEGEIRGGFYWHSVDPTIKESWVWR
jgi:hypothetical protein